MHFVEWSCWRDERIQASIRPHVFSDFESIIEEDDAYLMEKLVVDLDRKFKPTKHKYALSFVWVTKVTKLLDTNSIPKVYFDFVTYADLEEQMQLMNFYLICMNFIEKSCFTLLIYSNIDLLKKINGNLPWRFGVIIEFGNFDFLYINILYFLFKISNYIISTIYELIKILLWKYASSSF